MSFKGNLMITRSYNADLFEHVVTVDGREVATAHKINAVWSVKIGPRLLGIAPSEEIAVLHLDRIAEQLRVETA